MSAAMDATVNPNAGESSTAGDANDGGGRSASGAVLCPFCETELPPDLLNRLQRQGGDADTDAGSGDKDHSQCETDHQGRPRPPALKASSKLPPSPLGGSLADTDTAPSGAGATASPGMLAPPPRGGAIRPQITTESLKQSLDESETAENSATSAIISADDIRRWSAIAGVPFVFPSPAPAGNSPPSSSAPTPPRSAVSVTGGKSSVAPSPAKAIPLIPPPPGAGKSPSQPSGRFGFFRGRSKLGMEDDESDDDEPGSATGYARVAGPGSDEDEDDGYESDKPFTPKKGKETSAEDKGGVEGTDMEDKAPPAVTVDTTSPTVPTVNVAHSIPPQTPVDELRNILGEVLNRVQLLSASHTELLSSHSTLLTSLKIARSNLVMAEANTEMLEDELKRLKPSSARSANTPDAPRGSIERVQDGARPRPSSVHGSTTPTPATSGSKNTTTTSTSSGFGFWKKSSSTAASGPASPTEATPSKHVSQTSTDQREEEVRQLRAQIEQQSDELEALKQGKKAIEAELEGLSQALFEEANKMVSDERRRRAELEESLREVKDEREALRQTVKVLGGRVRTPAIPGTPAAELTETDALGTLDAHYAALRRGIHHAVDGPSPAPSEGDASDSGESENEASGSGTEGEAEGSSGDERTGAGRTRSGTVTALTAKTNGLTPTLETGIPEPKKSFGEAEANPWG